MGTVAPVTEMKNFESSHFTSILNIWNHIITKEDCFMYDAPFTPEEFQALLDTQRLVRCALIGGEVAGFYFLHPNAPGKGSHVANATYAVGEEFRKNGTGKILALDSFEAAGAMGFRAMQFNAVVSTNAGAINLWQMLGFMRVGEVPYAYRTKLGENASIYIFYKSLIVEQGNI